MLRALVAAVASAIAVSIAGCAPTADSAWAPPTWDDAKVAVVPTPVPIDLAATPELAQTLTAVRLRNDDVALQGRAMFLPGTGSAVAGFNAAVEQRLRDDIGAASRASGAGYEPQAHDTSAGLSDRACRAGSTAHDAAVVLADPVDGPAGGTGTALVCDVVAATGPFLAQRLRTVSGGSEGVTADVVTTTYVDTATGEVAAAEDLWTEDAAERLGADVIDALRRDAGALSLREATVGGEEQLAVIREALGSTVPVDGALVFTLPAGFSSPELTRLGVAETQEPLSIAVPAAAADPLVTPFGARLLAASGEPYAGPDAVAASREWTDCALVPCVALTYDDGPSQFTPMLLDTLAEHRVAATLYLLGQYASANPDPVRRAAAEGHEIGNHTWDHPSLPDLNDEQIQQQLSRTGALLRSLSGQPVATFRPPYGAFTADVLAAAGEPAILWTVDTRDWAGGPDDAVLRSAVDDAQPGGIVLLHDTHERSVRMTGEIIEGLRDRGLSPVTVTQLFDGDLPASGAWRGAP